MTSRLGVIGAAAVLLAIPLALLSVLAGADPETSLHLFIGLGFVLVACAIFDFKAPRGVSWVGWIGIGGLGAIFMLQGASDLLGSAPLHQVAYGVLGQLPERVAPDLFILWCGWVAWHSLRGRVRLFGVAVVGCSSASRCWTTDFGSAVVSPQARSSCSTCSRSSGCSSRAEHRESLNEWRLREASVDSPSIYSARQGRTPS